MTRTLLQTLLEEYLERNHFSARDAAEEIGVSATTIGRLRAGETADVDTILKVSKAFRVSPSDLINAYMPPGDGLEAKIALIIKQVPGLDKYFAELLEQLENEQVDLKTAEDIIAYSAYRLSLGSHNDENNAISDTSGGAGRLRH